MGQVRLQLKEVFGFTPPVKAARECVRGLKGDPYTPGHLFGLSSLGILNPKQSVKTWLGVWRSDRKVEIYNFFNRRPYAKDAPHSVEKKNCEDWRGLKCTYDGHKATDFVVPVGTVVAAAAPGRVVRVEREFDRGGLHVMIDHGDGFVTTASHLARSLVREGDEVRRGQPYALSGAAGMDFVLLFPWSSPHIHFNTWLNGEPADPFARPDEEPLWIRGNDPRPWAGAVDDEYERTEWSADLVEEAIRHCRDPELARRMRSYEDLERRAAEVMFQRILRPTRFSAFPPLYDRKWPRRRYLSLPLRPEDCDGLWYEGIADHQM